MSNFNKVSVGEEARTELHEKLFLTGAEVSINNMAQGTSVPFIHSHKKFTGFLQAEAGQLLMERR